MAKKKHTRLTKEGEASCRQLSLKQFKDLQKKTLPFAEAQGFLTDEDVFYKIS